MTSKKKISNLFIFLALSLVVSCSSKTKTKPTILVGIDDAPKIKKIMIKEGASSGQFGPQPMGPLPPGKAAKSTQETRDPIIAVHCHDALYRSLYCLDVIESIEKRSKVAILSGEGMSALVLALYGKYRNKNKVQWTYFKLIKKLKNKRIFYPDWFREIQSFLNREFKKKRNEQLKKIIFYPLYDRSQDQFKLVNSGRVSSLILDQFNHTGGDKSLSPLVSKEPFDIDALKKAGADLVYRVGLGVEQLKLGITDGHYFGNYGHYFSYLPNLLESPFIYYYEKTKLIDSIQDFFIEEQIPVEQLEQSSQKILEDVKNWKDEIYN
jgi:hypothetical protein